MKCGLSTRQEDSNSETATRHVFLKFLTALRAEFDMIIVK